LKAFTEGLDYPAEEESMYLEETAGELLNIVVGNAADKFAPDDEVVTFSPPIVITEAKSILKNNRATFYAVEMSTTAGMLYIYIIGPKHLFDDELNYIEEVPMEGMNVMIVDDSLIAVRKLSQLLENLGYRVAGTCKTGKEACRMYAELKPDLVSMDITMPDMDGITATREILSQDPSALVIMVTSHGQEQMVIDAIEAGAKGYILKPFNQKKVSETIEKVKQKYSR
jgi:CheY-like chemotaxis protein